MNAFAFGLKSSLVAVIGLVAIQATAGAQVPARKEPEEPFAQMQGKLPLPAPGRQVLSFGETTKHGGASKGIVIEAKTGSPVVAPADGLIMFAGAFPTHGPVVIIDAGGGHHILLSGLGQIIVQSGQFVVSGEPLATASPVLYMELRKNGDAIDPGPWWKKN
jgi:septal ring factor EnvC (AmiA/AmiB activator)